MSFDSNENDSNNLNQNQSNISPVNNLQEHKIINNKKVHLYFLLFLLIVSCIGFIPIISIFFIPLLLAITFSALSFPVYKYFLKLLKGNRTLSSIIVCILFLICLLIPVTIFINIVVHQMFTLYSSTAPLIQEFLEKGSQSQIVQKLMTLSIFKWIQRYQIDWLAILKDFTSRLAFLGTFLINKTSSGILGLFANLFITIFTMFYFFIDGERILKRLRYLSPVRSEYQEIILNRFLLISRATILGTILIGLIQGSFGALTLFIFGIKSWLVWGFIMILLAIIPMAGTWLVLIPAGIIQIIIGNVWQGIGIILCSTLIVSNIDNLIRPRIVGYGAKMHDLLIFFSTLGGLSLFGVAGFIIGPIIASFFITMIDIYEMEFGSNRDTLEKNE